MVGLASAADRRSDHGEQVGADLIDVLASVDDVEDAVAAVVVHNRVERAELLAQPGLDRCGLVVVALIELGPIHVADSGLLRRLGPPGGGMGSGAADPAPAE